MSAYAAKNASVRSLAITPYRCPSASAPYSGGNGAYGYSCYAAVHHEVEAPIDDDNNGVFFLNSRIRYEDITDGISHTLFLGEKIVDVANDLGWMSGTRATLRNTGTPVNMDLPTLAGTAGAQGAGNDKHKDKTAEQPGAQPDSASADSTDKPPPNSGAASTAADPALRVGGFGSEHLGHVVVFAFGDGHVRVMCDTINPVVFSQLGHRADGKLLDATALDW